jgi:hypothetical protein
MSQMRTLAMAACLAGSAGCMSSDLFGHRHGGTCCGRLTGMSRGVEYGPAVDCYPLVPDCPVCEETVMPGTALGGAPGVVESFAPPALIQEAPLLAPPPGLAPGLTPPGELAPPGPGETRLLPATPVAPGKAVTVGPAYAKPMPYAPPAGGK